MESTNFVGPPFLFMDATLFFFNFEIRLRRCLLLALIFAIFFLFVDAVLFFLDAFFSGGRFAIFFAFLATNSVDRRFLRIPYLPRPIFYSVSYFFNNVFMFPPPTVARDLPVSDSFVVFSLSF